MSPHQRDPTDKEHLDILEKRIADLSASQQLANEKRCIDLTLLLSFMSVFLELTAYSSGNDLVKIRERIRQHLIRRKTPKHSGLTYSGKYRLATRGDWTECFAERYRLGAQGEGGVA